MDNSEREEHLCGPEIGFDSLRSAETSLTGSAGHRTRNNQPEVFNDLVKTCRHREQVFNASQGRINFHHSKQSLHYSHLLNYGLSIDAESSEFLTEESHACLSQEFTVSGFGKFQEPKEGIVLAAPSLHLLRKIVGDFVEGSTVFLFLARFGGSLRDRRTCVDRNLASSPFSLRSERAVLEPSIAIISASLQDVWKDYSVLIDLRFDTVASENPVALVKSILGH